MRSPLARTASRVTFLGLILTALALSPASAADWYVRQTPCDPVTQCPPSFPSPWSGAMPSLQDALAAASSGDTIHVAKGIYLPDDGAGIPAGDRNAVFCLRTGVRLKGGYEGAPTLPDPVDPVTYPGDPVGVISGRTTLSGDVGLSGDFTDNSLLVVDAPPGVISTAVLEGFDVVNECLPGGVCQALRVRGSSPTVSNSSFKGRGSNGGAITINGPNAAITWSGVIADGDATLNGGAIYAVSFIHPITLNGVDLQGRATQGGGLYHAGGKLTLSGQIHDSKAGRAAGIYFSGQEVYLNTLTIARNEAGDDLGGGELVVGAGGVIEVSSSTVSDNIAWGLHGTTSPTGGLRLVRGRQKVLLSRFERNMVYGSDPAHIPTSALQLQHSDVSNGAHVINCLFSGVSTYAYPEPVLLHFDGGGPGLVASSTLSGPGCENSGQWYYGQAGIRWTGASLKVANTVLTEHYPFDFDPGFPTQFVASQIHGLFAPSPFTPGTCMPAPGSPLLDAGDNSEVPPTLTTSLNGARRRGACPNPVVDVGAFEFIPLTRACLADWDSDCAVAVSDIFDYLREYFAQTSQADLNNDGQWDTTDLNGTFLPAWFAGCP